MVAADRRLDEARALFVAAAERQPEKRSTRVRSIVGQADRVPVARVAAEAPRDRLANHGAKLLLSHRS